MKCPYCSSEMEEGYIPSDRYSLKWISRKRKSKIPLLYERIKLSTMSTQPDVEAFYCSECKKIVIDLKNK